MDLDEETRALLGFSGQADEIDFARYFAVLAARRKESQQTYTSDPVVREKRAKVEKKFTTRQQRANRKRSKTLKKLHANKRTEPVLKGYARIKAWREKNPAKYAAIQKRYEKSDKRKVVKSRSNKKQHAKRKGR